MAIVAAGAIGGTVLGLIALVLLFHVMKVEETFVIMIAAVIIAYFWFTSR